MQNPLLVSLVVTGIGMLALFLALLVLYCLMYLMTAVLQERPAGDTHPREIREDLPGQDNDLLLAAAIATALARAELEQAQAYAPPTTERQSAWRALHHQRQLSSRREHRR